MPKQLNPIFVERVARMYCELMGMDADAILEIANQDGTTEGILTWQLVAQDVPSQVAWFTAITSTQRKMMEEAKPKIVVPH